MNSSLLSVLVVLTVVSVCSAGYNPPVELKTPEGYTTQDMACTDVGDQCPLNKSAVYKCLDCLNGDQDCINHVYDAQGNHIIRCHS